jgi:anhydro-N-acetylmuramic acid kinase
MADLYIGLISGTSMDGIDAVLVNFGEASVDTRATHTHAYPDELRAALRRATADPSACTVDTVGELDSRIGDCFRDAALALLDEAGVTAGDVGAIGSHGQTLRHMPKAAHPFTLQVGDPWRIAVGTGITTIADFRRADLALGGQGAPLMPPFHEWLFRRPGSTRVVLNLGGIANVTILPADDAPVTGFDTGPGNTLLDVWIAQHAGEPFDRGGEWSASGEVAATLLERLAADQYFAAPPPKSTGFEHFNARWLEAAGADEFEPADVQATLAQLTADTVAEAVRTAGARELLICGGGVHNRDVLRRLGGALPDVDVRSTAEAGLDPDWVEAAGFAWLAKRRMENLPGNLPSVTGASRPAVLGALFAPC